jgi:hypothetical protein
MNEEKTVELIEKPRHGKVVNEDVCLIAMPQEAVRVILCASSNVVADPSMFCDLQRQHIHERLNEVIARINPFVNRIV